LLKVGEDSPAGCEQCSGKRCKGSIRPFRGTSKGRDVPVYSSQIDSRRDAVLVNHTTQSIGSPDLTAAPSAIAGGVGFGGVRRTPDVDDVRCSDQRRREGTWWRCARLRTSSQSRHSERTVRTNRSATPFACGARNGVRTISIPSLRNILRAPIDSSVAGRAAP
jgi:hypothetical protein